MIMKTEIVFVFLLIVLAILGTSVQDGFNFYKALNRTPISRVERFYRDNGHSRYKVPLTKRLFYDGINEQKEILMKQNEDLISLLLNWYPDIKSNSPSQKEKQEEKCIDIENVLPNNLE